MEVQCIFLYRCFHTQAHKIFPVYVEKTDTEKSAETYTQTTTHANNNTLTISQLNSNGVTLKEGNITSWERDLRTLNITRAKLTTQILAVLDETSTLCESVNLDSQALLYLIKQDGNKEGKVVNLEAQEAAVELLVSSSVSNPPGSQPLFTALKQLKSCLDKVLVDRATAVMITSKFSTHLNTILSGEDSSASGLKANPKDTQKGSSLDAKLSAIGDVR
jgi:hypothetical protein